MSDLYDSDVLLWCERQSGLLRRVAAGDPSNEAPDWPNIIEEIESMGRRERRELAKRLRLLLGHLLKWSFQPGGRCTSWELTIIEQRRRLGYHLADNPSLKADETIGRAMAEGYELGVLLAARETRLDVAVFPESCPWSYGEVADPSFWPDAP